MVELSPSSDELWVEEEKCSVVSDVVIDWMIVESVGEDVCSVTTPEDWVLDWVGGNSSKKLVVVAAWDVDSILTGIVLSVGISGFIMIDDWVDGKVEIDDIDTPLDEASVG